MSQLVTIKSNKTGLTLILDPFVPFNDLCIAVCQKFSESSAFFREAKTSLAFDGRTLSNEEINMIIECIEANCGLYIAYIQDNDEVRDRQMISGITKIIGQDVLTTAKIFAGSVFSGDTVESDRSLLILGDVRDGGLVKAAGNIIITGTIYGVVQAGFPDNRNVFIYAKDYETQIFRIGDMTQEIQKIKKSKLSLLTHKNEGYSFSVYDGEIICEPFEKGLIKQIVEQ